MYFCCEPLGLSIYFLKCPLTLQGTSAVSLPSPCLVRQPGPTSRSGWSTSRASYGHANGRTSCTMSTNPTRSFGFMWLPQGRREAEGSCGGIRWLLFYVGALALGHPRDGGPNALLHQMDINVPSGCMSLLFEWKYG